MAPQLKSFAQEASIHRTFHNLFTTFPPGRAPQAARVTTFRVKAAAQVEILSPAVKPAVATDAVERSLRTWITAHGGFVHPSIRLTESAPCGCRGVVAASPLSIDDVQSQPLIVVPEVHTRASPQGLGLHRTGLVVGVY